jgi:hypothetical protein
MLERNYGDHHPDYQRQALKGRFETGCQDVA